MPEDQYELVLGEVSLVELLKRRMVEVIAEQRYDVARLQRDSADASMRALMLLGGAPWTPIQLVSNAEAEFEALKNALNDQDLVRAVHHAKLLAAWALALRAELPICEKCEQYPCGCGALDEPEVRNDEPCEVCEEEPCQCCEICKGPCQGH